MQTTSQHKTPSSPLPAKVPSGGSDGQTIEVRLLGVIPKAPSIFFIDDVRLKGVPMKQIRFTLAKLALDKGNTIIRLAWGIYASVGLGEESRKSVLPSPEEIAYAVARKSCLTIIPSGERAARRVGLLERKPEDYYEWFTSGGPREIRLCDGKTIRFLMSRENRVFSFRDDRMRDLCNGMRFLGKFNIGYPEIDAIRIWLKQIPEDVYKADLELCPEWVRELMEECREKGGRPAPGDAENTEREKGKDAGVEVEVA